MQINAVAARWMLRDSGRADVSFRIDEGEIFGLIGPNGAGKSTLVKMLTAMLPPSTGGAFVAGFDVATRPSQVRKHIGYVPQLLSARLYLIPRADREKKIREALSMMGLSEVRDRLVRSYSGGMIRRLEIAQSTLHRPAVLFMDEPTVGLDPSGRHAVWNHIRDLRRDMGAAIVVTTHYMDEAEELCDRIAVPRAGRITAVGTPAALKAALGPPSSPPSR